MPQGDVTTWTQAGFSFCAGCLGPLFGAWGASVVRGTRLHSLLGLLTAAAGSWGGWAVSAVVAWSLHPRYPHGGPSEAVALWYLVPGFVSGAASIALLYRRALASPRMEHIAPPSRPGWLAVLSYRRSPRPPDQEVTHAGAPPRSPVKKRLGWAIAIACAAIGYGACRYELSTWGYRRSLPVGATRVHEWAYEDGFPDSGYLYRLKAQIDPAEFEAYMSALQLSPYRATRRGATGAWTPRWSPTGEQTPWFNPSPDLSRTFVAAGSGCRSSCQAKYEEGWIYVEARAVDNGTPGACE